MASKRVAKKPKEPKYSAGQVVYRIHYARYEMIVDVAGGFVFFASGPVVNSDVRPLTKRERG